MSGREAIYDSLSPSDKKKYIALLVGGTPPLYGCIVALSCVVVDYLVTVEDEIKYIWPQKRGTGKFMFLFVRYYTIIMLMFDVIQIHTFQIPGVTSDTVCVAMDSIIRIIGAISLYAVEIIMQLRVYAIYKCSMKVAIFNATLFIASIAGFMYILIFNAEHRRAVIADAIHLNAPGCPSIHTGIEWAQWVPATGFEGVLFFFAIYKTLSSTASRARQGMRVSIYSLVLRDNLFYFFGISVLLVLNNLMVVGATKVPWFSYGPFHAATGILTCRMLINLRKASAMQIKGSGPSAATGSSTDNSYQLSAIKFGGDKRPQFDLALPTHTASSGSTTKYYS